MWDFRWIIASDLLARISLNDLPQGAVVRAYAYLRAVFFYEGHLESKERFAIKKYLLIIGKKKNMQVLSHTFTYFST